MAKHLAISPVLDEATLAKAMADLSRRDKGLARAIEYAGPLPDRRLPGGFATIAKIIVEQQLSLIAAAAIWQRVGDDLGDITPETVLSRDVPHLRSLGLGARKAEYLQGVATSYLSGDLNLEAMKSMPDEEAIAHLTAVRGIGPWTAEVYLLFAEGRSDIFPAGDVALQSAAQFAYETDSRPDADALRTMAKGWRPWRAAAARILWQVYRRLQEAKKAG